jgi:hypothetical protein
MKNLKISLRSLITTTLSILVLSFSQPAHAALDFFTLQADDNTTYLALTNNLYSQVLLTQFIASNGPGVSQSAANTSLVAYVSTTDDLFSVSGQSLVNSGLIDSFDTTGSGTIHFNGGTNINAGSFNIFEGVATVNLPPPSGVYPAPYNVYGFDLAPGANPTIQLPIFGSAPSDGLALALNQSIVFKLQAPYSQGQAYGVAGFAFNEQGQANLSFGKVDSFPGRPSPVPEPASMFLLGSGLLGGLRFIRKK